MKELALKHCNLHLNVSVVVLDSFHLEMTAQGHIYLILILTHLNGIPDYIILHVMCEIILLPLRLRYFF